MVLNASFLDTSEIAVDKKAAIMKLNNLAEKFCKFGWVSCHEADDAKE